jgi:adenosylcobalamin-dependent ribonucleoside-triphosphate reductase
MDYGSIVEKIADNGEPGVIWLDTMRERGRLADPPNHKDNRAMGCNPCAEQTLESFELCCLVETFPAKHDTYEDYQKTLKFAYLYAKTVTLIPTHDSRVNAVMLRNRRIGCSMSGIIQAMNKFGRRSFLNHCDKGYDYIQRCDKHYSEWLCVPRSIKTTSVKPSGTVSLLCGSTPGIHYPHSEYYIRNIRVQDTSPLAEAATSAGYPVERCAYSKDSYVISFPVKEEHFERSKDDVSIWQQFANAADLQKWWADNQVSITITFTQKEKGQILSCLEHYEDKLKSVSLLPISEHGYVQAPYIKITEEEYNTL